MADPDPTLAGQKATTHMALDLTALSVIGVMQAHDGKAALLRSAQGQIARVLVGQDAFGIRITAIGDNQILTTDRWGRTQSLEIPQG